MRGNGRMALSEDQRWLGGRFGIARKAAWLGRTQSIRSATHEQYIRRHSRTTTRLNVVHSFPT